MRIISPCFYLKTADLPYLIKSALSVAEPYGKFQLPTTPYGPTVPNEHVRELIQSLYRKIDEGSETRVETTYSYSK